MVLRTSRRKPANCSCDSAVILSAVSGAVFGGGEPSERGNTMSGAAFALLPGAGTSAPIDDEPPVAAVVGLCSVVGLSLHAPSAPSASATAKTRVRTRYARSNKPAAPWPPPMHIVTTA